MTNFLRNLFSNERKLMKNIEDKAIMRRIL